MARQIRNEDAPSLCQQRREEGEVDGRAPQSVDDDERRALTAHEVARAGAADFGEPLIEPSEGAFASATADEYCVHMDLEGARSL